MILQTEATGATHAQQFAKLVADGQFTATALCGALLAFAEPSTVLRLKCPTLCDVIDTACLPALKTSLKYAIENLRIFDKGGSFCDPQREPSRMATVIRLHEVIQYIALAAVHLLQDKAFATSRK